MRYVSTRGEAPPLDFVEVMLAGLARDGGLYVPETWPRLDAQTIAGFAGREKLREELQSQLRTIGNIKDPAARAPGKASTNLSAAN